MFKSRLFKRIEEQGKEKLLLYVNPKPMRKGIIIKFHDMLYQQNVQEDMLQLIEL